MASQDIEINVVTKGVQSLQDVSLALRGIVLAAQDNVRVVGQLDARQRGLNQALGVTAKGFGEHAKNLSETARNQGTLSKSIRETTDDLKRLRTEMALGRGGMGFPGLVKDLELAQRSLNRMKPRALVSDLRSVSVQLKRLGKDAQFVGRSLIIGLTTPIMGFANKGLSALYSLEKQLVKVTKIISKASAEQQIGEKEAKGFRDFGYEIAATTPRLEAINMVLRQTSLELGISRDALTAITADFAVLGVTAGDTLAILTRTAGEVSLLGAMDLDASQELTQTLFLGMQRALDKRGELFESAAEKQAKATELLRSQIYLFNAVENATSMSFKDIAQSLPEIAAAVTEFGLSFMEGLALTAPIKAAGIQVSVAANAIKMSLQRLTAPTITAQKHMAGLESQMQELIQSSPKLAGAFDNIFGIGMIGMQALVDITEAVSGLPDGQAKAMAMYSKLFDKRQSTRMKIAVDDLVSFQREMNNTGTGAGRLIGRVNSLIEQQNRLNGSTVPLIKTIKDLSTVTKLANTEMVPGEEIIISNQKFLEKDIKSAEEVRKQLQNEFKTSFDEGNNIIKEISQESGKVMFTQLLGAGGAADLAKAELQVAIDSIAVAIDTIKIALKEISISFIEDFKSTIESLSKGMVKLAKFFENLDPSVRKAISFFAAFVAAIGPLVFIFGQAKLATGVLMGTFLKFLPSLKTMGIESLASRSGLLYLKNGLTLTGNTVQNTNTKFATLIATMAGGKGPVALFARRFGRITGILRSTKTASADVLSRLDQVSVAGQRAIALADATPRSVGPIVPIDPARRKLRARALRRELRPFTDKQLDRGRDLIPKIGGGYVARGPSGQFRSLTAKDQKALDARNAIEAQRQRRIEALAMRRQRRDLMAAKGISSSAATGKFAFRGREITEKRATSITRGGIRGRIALAAESAKTAGSVVGRAAMAPVTATKAVATAPVKAFKSLVDASKGSVNDLIKTNKALEIAAPNTFQKIIAGVKGFITQLGIARKMTVLLKMAFIGIGIGALIIGAVAAVLFFIKNFNKIKESAQPIITALKNAWEALGRIINAIMTPVKDFFAAVMGGNKGSDNAMSGLTNAFQKVADFIDKAANAVEKFVNQYIVPFITLALGAVVGFIDGVKGIVVAFIGVAKGSAGAMEQLKESASKAFESIVQLVLGVVAPALVTIIAAAIKVIIKIFFGLIEFLPKILGIAIKLFLEWRMLIIKVFVFLLSGALKILAKLPSGIGKILAKIVDMFADMVERLTSMLMRIPGAERVLGLAVRGVRAYGSSLEFVGNKLSEGLEIGVGKVVEDLNWLVDKMDDFTSFIGDGAMNIGNALSDKLGDALKDTPDAANAFIDNLANTLKESLRKYRPEGVKAAGDFWDGFLKGTERERGNINEKITDPLVDGAGNAGEDAAKEFAKKFKEEIDRLRQKFVDLVLGFFDNSINEVVDSLVKALDKQREAALEVFEEQLDVIKKLEKAEESLMRYREYLADRRRLLDERELNRQNYVRNRALAIYEGRIDDARMLDLEERKSKMDSAKSITDLDDKRNKDLAKENLDFIKQQIQKTKEEADKFFREQIEAFKEASKEITKFAPQTIEEYEQQLNALTELAKQAAIDNGEAFAETFKKMEEAISVGLPNIGSGVFTDNLQDLINIAKEKYGLTSPSENSIVGATIAMLNGVSQAIVSDGVIINRSMDEILQSLKSDVVDKALNDINQIFEDKNPHKVLAAAIEFANETIRREFERTVGHIASKVDQLANSMDPFIAKIVEAQLAMEALRNAVNGTMGGGGSTGSLGGSGGSTTVPLPPPPSIPPPSGTTDVYSWLKANPDALDAWQMTTMSADEFIRQWELSKMEWELSNQLRYFSNGGFVRGFDSQSIPAMLHGGEFVVNSKAVSNIGLAALESINSMRHGVSSDFSDSNIANLPSSASQKAFDVINSLKANVFTAPRYFSADQLPQQASASAMDALSRNQRVYANPGGIPNESNSSHNYNIYVDNFIGEENWFESMMKTYNMKVVPRNQKNAGVQSRTVSTYSGINRGM
jgi:TP901 family phage tail tape measure protein